jgi:Tfp pilus assembly protein FimT
MLAISIAAIVMAIGLPGWIKALKKEGLRKAVSDVVEGCSQARAQAILKGVPMEFVLRAEDGSISVQAARLSRGEAVGSGQSGEGSGSAGEFAGSFSGQLPNDVGVKLIYVNFQDKMELPEARVRFFPNGTCDEFTVILFSPSGEKKISADLITGLTEVDTIR